MVILEQSINPGYNNNMDNARREKIRAFLRKIFPYWPWIIVCGFLFVIFLGIFTYFYYVGDLATSEKLMNRNNTGLVLYDRHKTPIFKSEGVKDFEPVGLSEIAIDLQDATVAIEDKEFYAHPGFSLRAIFRSLYSNFKSISPTKYGGSTITQQLIKNAILTPEKSVKRKYQELILALEVDRRYKKNQILEMYLNSIYYGSGAYGIEEAANIYFDKSASKLTLAESAILAALPQSPSRLTPFGGDIESLEKRKNLVLEEMIKQKYITLDEKNSAGKEDVKFAPPPSEQTNNSAPHFSLFVRDFLYKEYGEDVVLRQGFRVTTTLDLTFQKAAQEILTNQVKRLASQKVSNGAVVTINPNSGEILVLLGSADYSNEQFGKFNVVFAKRQPGSAFKPIVYTKAFMEGFKPIDILHDQPTDFNGYKPKNYDGRFRGDVTIRRALSNSLNVPAVELLNKVGVKNAIELASSMGISTLTDANRYGLSLVLGGGEVELFELTRAYGVLATQGVFVPSHFVLHIEDKFNNTIYTYNPDTKTEDKPSNGINLGDLLSSDSDTEMEKKHIGGSGDTRIIDEASAYLTTHILSDEKARSEIFGSGSALLLSRPAGAKTGTTDDYRDAWTVGYTPDFVTGVWLGNNDNTPMGRIAGSLGAAPIWKSVMELIHKGKGIHAFSRPSSILELAICVGTFQPACAGCGDKYMEVFRAADAPRLSCPEDITPSPSEPTTTDKPSDTPTPQPSATPNPTPTSLPEPTSIPSITTFPSVIIEIP